MISPGIEISIAGGVVAIVHGPISASCFFSFFSFFLYLALFVFRYKKPYAAGAMNRKNPITQSNR